MGAGSLFPLPHGAQDIKPSPLIAIKAEMGLGGAMVGPEVDLLRLPYDKDELQKLREEFLRPYAAADTRQSTNRSGRFRLNSAALAPRSFVERYHKRLVPVFEHLEEQISGFQPPAASFQLAAAGFRAAAAGDGGGMPHQQLLFALRLLELHKVKSQPQQLMALRRLAAAVMGVSGEGLEDDPEMVGVDVIDLTLDEADDRVVIDTEAMVESLTPLVGRYAPPLAAVKSKLSEFKLI